VAEPTIDNAKTAPLFLDVSIDSANNIADNRAIFAFQGDIDNRYGRSLPFILFSTGRVDFGESYDTGERYGELDLREGKIFEGRLLRFQGTGYDEMFRITKIHSLC
jgi:hypothetical protein